MRIFLVLISIASFALASCQTLDRGSFGPFKRSLNNKSYGYSVVKDFTGRSGVEFVERFEVRAGDCGSSSQWSDCRSDRERSELSGPKDGFQGSINWYGWSIFVPETFQNIFPTKLALGQFHQLRGLPAFMFQNSVGGYWFDENFGHSRIPIKLIADEELLGKWNRIEVHAKWHKSDGFMKVFVNGEQKVDFRGRTMTEDVVYFKYGVYRSFVSRYKNFYRKSLPTQIVYFANVKRSKTREGLN